MVFLWLSIPSLGKQSPLSSPELIISAVPDTLCLPPPGTSLPLEASSGNTPWLTERQMGSRSPHLTIGKP